MREADAVEMLKEIWQKEGHDSEAAHGQADDLLIEYLHEHAPLLAATFDRMRDDVGFWYA